MDNIPSTKDRAEYRVQSSPPKDCVLSLSKVTSVTSINSAESSEGLFRVVTLGGVIGKPSSPLRLPRETCLETRLTL